MAGYSIKLRLSSFVLTFAEFYGFLEFSGEYFDGGEYIEPDLSASRLEEAARDNPNAIIDEYTFVLSGFGEPDDSPGVIALRLARFENDLNRDLIDFVEAIYSDREDVREYAEERADVSAIIEAASTDELNEIRALLSSSNAANRIKARINRDVRIIESLGGRE